MDENGPAETGTPLERPNGGVRALAGLHSTELYCQTCGQRTRHRVLRLARVRTRVDGREAEGLARCSQCRWTHPFVLFLPDTVQIPAVLSDGARSARSTVAVASDRRLQVGSRVPGQVPPIRILRIDRRDGKRVSEAVAGQVATLWVAPDVPRPIPVSLVLGSRTATTRATLPPDQLVEVGGTVDVAGATLRVVGLRARGETWRQVGDRFPAREVARIYTRRMDSPPAGRSRWSRSRETPSSRETSTSRSERSRSGPGVRIRRRRPRPRTAAAGAAVHRVSPS